MGAEQGERSPAPVGGGARPEPDQHHEDDNHRQGDEQDRPGRDVAGEDPGQEDDRNQHGKHQLGQVAGEVDLQRVHALNRGGDELAAALLAQPGGPGVEKVRGDAAAQFAHHPPGTDPPGGLEPAGAQGSEGNDCGQEPEQRRGIGEIVAAREGAGNDPSQQRGLGNDQDRGQESEDDRNGEGEPRGPYRAKQAAVDRRAGASGRGFAHVRILRSPATSQAPGLHWVDIAVPPGDDRLRRGRFVGVVASRGSRWPR